MENGAEIQIYYNFIIVWFAKNTPSLPSKFKNWGILKIANSYLLGTVNFIEIGRFLATFSNFRKKKQRFLNTVFVVPENSFKRSMYFCEKCYKITKNRPISLQMTVPNCLEFEILKTPQIFEFG